MKNNVKNETFGDFFKSKRISLGLSLRSFCEKNHFDPGNISRMERGLLSPTVEEKKLIVYAEALKISEKSSEWAKFFDLANIAKGTIPSDIREDLNLMSIMPAFYRTVRGEKFDKDKLEKLFELLNTKK